MKPNPKVQWAERKAALARVSAPSRRAEKAPFFPLPFFYGDSGRFVQRKSGNNFHRKIQANSRSFLTIESLAISA